MKLYALIALALLSACKDETISGYAPNDAVWRLGTLNGVAFDARATLSFPETGRIAGHAPCNTYFGSQTAPYPWFAVEGLGSTKRACPDLNAESAYFEALAKMTLSEVSGGTLILSNAVGDQMVFKTSD